MPKELTYDFREHTPDGANSRVQITWRPDYPEVQIGTVNPAGTPDVSGGTGPESNGWFVNLDRPAINKLIRDLRRARNASYGVDE
jgi:hypothetical protein